MSNLKWIKRTFFFIGLIFLLFSCQEQQSPKVSFYYWKTVFRLLPLEKNTLLENNVEKLYVRYCDIDLLLDSQEPFPRSPIHFESTTKGFEIVPVIYIKNNVMLKKNLNISDLAKKINTFIGKINSKNGISVQEIQIDCDWTLASKNNYLQFIEKFKSLSEKKLSATIRLHQIKYFEKTKIPNVDRGVLMYYNMGKIAPDSLNSIYDRTIASKYLSSLKKYPLEIAVALPIYSWNIHIRDAKVIGLQSKTKYDTDRYFVKTKGNRFRVKESNYKAGIYYKRGDLLKQEAITDTDLLEMAEELEKNLKEYPKEIIFYDLDQFNIENHEKHIFKKVINCF
jgi:hypothetical protein